MYPLSHSSTSLTQSEDAVMKLRLSGCAWVLVVQCLVMTLPILKLLHVPGVVNWPWIGVAAPFWAPGALLLVVFVVEWVANFGKNFLKQPHEPETRSVINS
jgi:hypothetical protein